MIPIIYAANETVFTHNGIGLLTDAIRCEVTEERNGIYEALIEYPITGIHYDSIAEDCIVKILPNEISNPQLFRIYKTGRPINGTITISLEHISYNLSGNPVTGYDVSGVGAAGAIQGALTAATFPHDFSAWSDITTLNSAKLDDPLSVRAILGGTAGGILDKWGGEYEFDNYVVKLHAQRGSATEVVIEYGKNLTDINQERNITNVYTSLFPYAKYVVRTPEGVETEHLVLLTENVLDAPNASSYAHKRAKIHDFSGDFDGEVTEAMLRAKANSYLAANPIDVPSVNIKVSFVQLWQTAEYANIAPLERVKLCDTVTVRFSKLGISATAKVIKTVYDSLLERYISIELGTAKSNFAQTINNQQQQINTINQNLKIETGALKQAILDATAAITGNMSGNVIFHPSLENPQEILIMDTEDIATATKVWRWNSGGLGYSSTGYNGPYGTAITMNGEIVADFIKTGNLNAGLITTGAINADLITTGKLQSVDGSSYFDLTNSSINVAKGNLGGWTVQEGGRLYKTNTGNKNSIFFNTNIGSSYSGDALAMTIGGEIDDVDTTWFGKDAPFTVTYGGSLTCKKGNIGGFDVSASRLESKAPSLYGTRGGLAKQIGSYENAAFFAGAYGDIGDGATASGVVSSFASESTGVVKAICAVAHKLPEYYPNNIIKNVTFENGTKYKGRHTIHVTSATEFTFSATFDGTETGVSWVKTPKAYITYNGSAVLEDASISGDILGTLSLPGDTNKMVLLNTYDSSVGADIQGLYWAENTVSTETLAKGAYESMLYSDAYIFNYSNGNNKGLDIYSKGKTDIYSEENMMLFSFDNITIKASTEILFYIGGSKVGYIDSTGYHNV